MFRLDGKIALVTGSSRGIGFALAKGLAEAGAHVVINSTKKEGAEKAAAELREAGLEASALAFDVTSEAEVTRGIEEVEKSIGAIDILINNAGIQIRTPLVDCPKETWDQVMRVNVDGPYLLCREVGRRMQTRQAGKIINICSLLSDLGRKTVVPYTTSKGAIKMLTKGLAVELAAHNVQVNGLAPGFFATELNAALVADEAFSTWLKQRTPAGRWGNVEDLVGAAVFLSAPASNFVCGQVLFVDGGITAAI